MSQPTHLVALVTGASRGAGRAIALELGTAGATVYVTGRSVEGGPTTDGVPGTIDETAREVTGRGGRGVPVRCDHTVDGDVESLFDRIRADHGRLDLLVNNVWGGYEDSACRPLPRVPFWEQSLHQWDGMFTAGLRAHIAASRLAVPLMLPRRRGLIASTTANLAPLPYLSNLFYDLAKNAVMRMTWAMAQELREHNIAALAVAPGFMRTERVVEAFRRAGALEAINGPGGPKETAAYLGRAIVALASDEGVIAKSGRLVEVGVLAREYGFTDVDGAQPPPFRISADPEAVVREFVDCINRHDAARLVARCSAEHRFVDSLGHEMTGRDQLLEGWSKYFALFPDYRVDIELVASAGEWVLSAGSASATAHVRTPREQHWRIPAAWRAHVRGGLIDLWQVYADNKPVYEILALGV